MTKQGKITCGAVTYHVGTQSNCHGMTHVLAACICGKRTTCCTQAVLLQQRASSPAADEHKTEWLFWLSW